MTLCTLQKYYVLRGDVQFRCEKYYEMGKKPKGQMVPFSVVKSAKLDQKIL